MCAIIDADTVHEVFGNNLNEAGEAFFDWIVEGSGHLIVGGKNEEELTRGSQGFRDWKWQLQSAGKMTVEDTEKVNIKTNKLIQNKACVSNDAHVIALAQVSGARLLYSNDSNLQQDFNNYRLIRRPRGKVYSTNSNSNFDRVKKRLLGLDLCRSK